MCKSSILILFCDLKLGFKVVETPRTIRLIFAESIRNRKTKHLFLKCNAENEGFDDKRTNGGLSIIENHY